MTKENALFSIVGLLVGLIVGFVFANSVNKSAIITSGASVGVSQSLPAGQSTAQPLANLPEVQAAIEKAKAEPQNFDAQVAAGDLYYKIQRFDGSVEYYAHANQIKPDDYYVMVQLGNANFELAKYEEAEKWYSQALSKTPDDVNVRTDLGLTFMFRQPADYDRAIQEFKRSLEYQPDHPQTLQNLTVAYTKKMDAVNARATLAKLESKEPSNAAIAKLRDDIEKLQAK
jgi:tetratricopeptide (TPR) repeat protein